MNQTPSNTIALPSTRSRLLKFLFGGLGGILLGGLLYWQIFRHRSFSIEQLWIEFQQHFSSLNIILFVFILLLMPLNWAAETLKWQTLMHPKKRLPFWQAYKAVLAGVTFSLFTPNRIGECGGRVWFVRSGDRMEAVFSALMGSFSQWVILIGGGVATLMLFVLQWDLFGNASWGIDVLTIIGTLLIIAGLSQLYFNLPKWGNKLTHLKWWEKWTSKWKISIFEYYTNKQLRISLGWALVRYLIYVSQYILFLYFFGLNIAFYDAFVAVGVIYLLQTGLPIPPSTGLIARGNFALFIFGFWRLSTLPILAATLSLWLLNVMLPAIIGAICIVVQYISQNNLPKNSRPIIEE